MSSRSQNCGGKIKCESRVAFRFDVRDRHVVASFDVLGLGFDKAHGQEHLERLARLPDISVQEVAHKPREEEMQNRYSGTAQP